MCLYSRLIINPKYKSTAKNKGVIPPLPDERVKYVPIGCGQCIECRKQKARGWQIRLLEDIRHTKNAQFITLTFSDESIKEIYEEIEDGTIEEIDNRIATQGVRWFLERWRKQYRKSLRHWLVTELGHNGTKNIHMHGIIWTDVPLEEVEKIWKYGYMWKGQYVNEKTINYIIKYVTKIDDENKTFKSKILTSPGIGRAYTTTGNAKLNNFNENKTIETYRTETGHKIAMPPYWRNKIYTEEEREKLWIQKLDEQVRYVRGEKVSIKRNERAYYALLKWHQRINKELGYGDGEKDWDREQYERQQRQMMNEKRIQKAYAIQNGALPRPE